MMPVVSDATESCLDQPETKETLEQRLNECLAAVKFLASRLATRLPAHVDVEDLVQVGLIGLLQSVERYDVRRGVKFQTYANRRVQGAMLDYLRSLDWRPRSVRKRNRQLAEAMAAIEQRTGAPAAEEEVAAEMGLSSPELNEWMMDYSSRGEQIQFAYAGQDSMEKPDDVLAWMTDPSDSPEAIVEKEQLRGRVAQFIERLPRNERAVLSLYYYEQRTMKEIGRALGVKQARVSQLHAQGLRRLRARMRRAQPASPASGAPEAAPTNGYTA